MALEELGTQKDAEIRWRLQRIRRELVGLHEDILAGLSEALRDEGGELLRRHIPKFGPR